MCTDDYDTWNATGKEITPNQVYFIYKINVYKINHPKENMSDTKT